MPLCKFFSLLLLAFCLFHHIVSGQDLIHMCLYAGNYTTNDPYESNLKELLSYLTDEAPTNGFAMGSKGEGENRTHGLALCRGDLSPTDCRNCVVHASNDMLIFCPYNKAAMIIHENCTIRYSNEDFFGQTVNNIMLCFKSPENIESDPMAMLFSQRIQEFLSQVSEEAVLNPKMYASGKSEIDEFNTAYGLAQCSRDLSRMDCKKCLNQSVAFLALPQCGQDQKEGVRVGVRVYSEICRVRYELNPFLKDNPLPLPSPSTSDAISPQPAPIASSHCLDAGILVLIGFLSLLLSIEF